MSHRGLRPRRRRKGRRRKGRRRVDINRTFDVIFMSVLQFDISDMEPSDQTPIYEHFSKFLYS